MAKGTEAIMATKTAADSVIVQSAPRGGFYVIALFAVGAFLYKSGYECGARVAKQVLKRHDKDVRSMEKKAKRFLDSDNEKKKKWFFI